MQNTGWVYLTTGARRCRRIQIIRESAGPRVRADDAILDTKVDVDYAPSVALRNGDRVVVESAVRRNERDGWIVQASGVGHSVGQGPRERVRQRAQAPDE
eukprot:scaffold1031_cov160-Pinguiococcus_pyrenoidosus.AAC.1